MSYFGDKFGSTDIRDEVLHNLGISWDTEIDEQGAMRFIAVLLHTPHMSNTAEHYHIELSMEQCRILHKWLDTHIKHIGGQ